MCHIIGIEPQFENIISNGPYIPMAAGQRKPETQWTPEERKAANLDQRLKSLIMSVLSDDQMNSIINCLTAKSTWDDLILYHELSDVKESRVMDLKLCYNTFKFKEGESLTQTFTRYKALMNELVNDGIKLSKLEINTGFINGLPKKWLTFCQSLRNTNHVKESELASLFGKLKYEENLINRLSRCDEEDTRSSQEYMNDLEEKYQARALLAKSKRFFKKEKVSSDDNEVTEVKALMALADEERVSVSKESARNGEWIKISMKKHPLPPLEKLTGDEPVFRPKTIKSILKSKSTFKAETLKGITINEPSSAPSRGNKGSSASKTNSAPAGKLKNVKMKDDPPLAIVMKELNELKLQISKNKSSYFRNKNSQQVPPNALQNKYKTQFKMNCELCGQNNHLSENCYEVLFCKRCKRTNHRTCDHAEFMSSMNINQYHTGQGESSSRSRPARPAIPFSSCIHYGYNDHKYDDCVYYPICEICGSYDHDTHGHNMIISLRRGIKPRNPQHVTKNCETCGSNVHTTSDHNDIKWFRKREALQANKVESFKASKIESTSALRSKTPTKRPEGMYGNNFTYTTEGYGYDKMAEGNVPAPTRTDDQLVPVKARLPTGKSNLLMDLQKKQKNPIFLISLDIPQNTNFFGAFTASANVPSITGTNVDYAELIWEEFVHVIKTFFSDAASLKVPSKKPKPHVIPYCRFTKFIICYLGGRHNIHKRPQSPLHISADDYTLSNLKFVPKGELDEVFGMAIPKDLLTDAIRNAEYYQKYLEMAARKPRQPTVVTDEESVKKKKVLQTDKSKKPAPAKQTKHVKEKSTKPCPSKKASKGKVLKVRKGKRYDRLVDEEDEEPQPASKPPVEDDEYNLQRGIQMSLESFQPPVGEVVIREPASGVTRSLPVVEVTEEASTGPSAQPQDDTSANVVCDTPYPANAESGADTEKSNSEGDTEILNVDEERGENVLDTVALEERTIKLDEGQAGLDPGNTLDSRPPLDEDQTGSNPGQSHVALAGPNPEPMHEDFIATVYPKVYKILKHTTEEHVFLENPPSSFGTISSIKNLDDAFTYGDQFLNDKPTEEELVPPLSTPVIDLTPTKPVSPPVQEPVFIATTTTLLPPPPPLQQQSTTDPELANRVSALEEICANLAKKNKLHDQTTQAFSSKIFTLENHDLYSKIDNYVNETVKEAVQNALQAPVPLYDSLEESMDRENREEFIKETTKSCKRRRDDQDPPPPPPKDSDQSKKKRHDSDASASKQPQAQTSSAWKTSDTREAPSSSSKQKTAFQYEQHVDDVPILDDVHISNTEDTGAAHLPKIKTRPDWLKPLPKEERPKTPKPTGLFLRMTYLKLRTTGPMQLPMRIKIQRRTS
ncbi:hypothetical protein Tco_0407415 [Tanacetum coccineum]